MLSHSLFRDEMYKTGEWWEDFSYSLRIESLEKIASKIDVSTEHVWTEQLLVL